MARAPLGGSTTDPFSDPADRQRPFGVVFDSIREPLIILDEHLRILTANSAFNKKFGSTNKKIKGKSFFEICKGCWDIPELRTLLEKVISRHENIDRYEVDKDFPKLGHRILLVHAEKLKYKNGQKTILVSVSDVTERRVLRAEREKLIAQKALLLKEMRHRIANNLQAIANILLIRAEEADSATSRAYLKDAHDRIMAIAEVQKQLDPDRLESGEEIEVGAYLRNLIKKLSQSIVGDQRPIAVSVKGDFGNVPSETAINIGFVTAELVINALKHAFPDDRKGNVIVMHEQNKKGWSLTVSDDGVAQSDLAEKSNQSGLGASIIGALAKQLKAVIRTERSSKGTRVTLFHANA